jgi:U3 small nucleolar ribonucleoprotein component
LKEENINFESSDPKELIKNLHDSFLQDSKILKCKDEKLIIKNMDNDQIWEQINLHLNPIEQMSQKYIQKISQKKT